MASLDEIYFLETNDPFECLSIEDSFLRDPLYSDKIILLVWRARPSVIIGRFQNPWLECDIDKCFKDSVNIVRRQSGGGTVYHDLGNINFSFIGKAKKDSNFKLILELLNFFEIDAEVNERNDILFKKLKISGSAFKKIRNNEMHHLTLLLDTNIETIQKYLHHDLLDIQTKSIKSKRSSMISLSQTNPNLSWESILKYFNATCFETHNKNLDKEKYYRSWDWVFGETPKFRLKGQEIIKGQLNGKRFNLKEFLETQ